MLVSRNELVSIGRTTYARRELLSEAIISVAKQSYRNIEVIIGNDNPSRLLTFDDLGINEDPRIRIVNHPKNLGELSNLNWLLSHAKGQFFTWLADDDLLHSQHIEILAKGLNSNENVVASFTGYTSNVSDFSKIENISTVEIEFTAFSTKDFISNYSSRDIKIVGCYGLFQRNQLLLAGGFKQLGEGFSPYSDTLIPVLMSKIGQIAVSSHPTAFFRSHSGSMSNTFTDLDSYLTAESDFIENIWPAISGFPEFHSERILLNFSSWFIDNHLTLISRSKASTLVNDILAFIHTSKVNRVLFLKYNLRIKNSYVSSILTFVKHRVRVRLNFMKD